jgi:FkbM family methyltransferase
MQGMAKGKESYSQNREDLLLAKIFSAKEYGVCVEVGAFDGVSFSNSLLLEQRGWDCILVEPNPHLCEQIRKNRPSAKLFACAASDLRGTAVLNFGMEADLYGTIEGGGLPLDRLRIESSGLKTVNVETRTLDDILQEAGHASIDFLSIDVEGHELSVLRGFDIGNWKPRIAILENNALREDPAVRQIMSQAGYRQVFQTGWCNNWYVQRDDAAINSFWKVLSLSGEPWRELIEMRIRPGIPVPLLNAIRFLRNPRSGSHGGHPAHR